MSTSRPFWCDWWPRPPHSAPKKPPCCRLMSWITSRGAPGVRPAVGAGDREHGAQQPVRPEAAEGAVRRAVEHGVPAHEVAPVGRELHAVHEAARPRLPERARAAPVDRRVAPGLRERPRTRAPPRPAAPSSAAPMPRARRPGRSPRRTRVARGAASAAGAPPVETAVEHPDGGARRDGQRQHEVQRRSCAAARRTSADPPGAG